MKTKTNYEKVREFHQAFGQDIDHKIVLSETSSRLFALRRRLVEEEYQEFLSAALEMPIFTSDLENLLKEMVDLLYVIYGMAATFGWDIDTAFNRVHASNMSKLGADGKPIYREDGKVLKSKNYIPPDLSDLV